MNIRDFEYLVALDEVKSFRKASERCHVTQPTLSGQLCKLEDLLGVQLVERARQGLMLTPAGREVTRRARLILAEMEQIKDISESFQDPMRGKLRMGLIPTLGPYLLPHVIPSLARNFPALELFLYEEQTHRLLQKLQSAEHDLIILALPVESKGMTAIELMDEPFLLAIPEGHGLTGKESVCIEDLQDERILLLEDGHCLRDHALEVCTLAGAKENPEFQGTSLETLRHMVSAGMGVTLMPHYSVPPADENPLPVQYLRFEDPAPSRTIGLLFRESSPRQACFTNIARTITQSLPSPANAGKLS